MSMKKKTLDKFKDISELVIKCAVVGIALTSPYAGHFVVGALREHLAKERKIKEDQINLRSLSQTLYYLKKRKIISLKKQGNQTILVLTERGRKRKFEYDWENLKIEKAAKWDGKWRILMFDVPEDARWVRDSLRIKLRQLSFVQFQKSVWICPYSCEDEIDFIGESLRIRSHLNLITANIDNDGPIRDKFGL